MATSRRSQNFRNVKSSLATNKKLDKASQDKIIKKLGPKFAAWLGVMVKTFSRNATGYHVSTSGYLTKYGLSARGRTGLAHQGTGLSATSYWRLENVLVDVQKKRHQKIMASETVIHAFDNLHRHRGLYKLKPGKGNMVLLDWTVFCMYRLKKFVRIPRFQVPNDEDFRDSISKKGLLFGARTEDFLADLQEKASQRLREILAGRFFASTLVSREAYIDRPRTVARDDNGNLICGRQARNGARLVGYESHAGAVLGGIEPTVASNSNSNSHVGVEENVKTLFSLLGKDDPTRPLFYDVLVSDIAIWQPLLLAQFSASNPAERLFNSLILFWDEFHWIKVRPGQLFAFVPSPRSVFL